MPDFDTDRIATSNLLFELGERFAVEATLWRDEDAQRNLTRTARHLTILGRQALTADLAVSEAYAEAGQLLIRNIEGVRRFLHSLATPPIVRRPE